MKKTNQKVLKYELDYNLVKELYHIIANQEFKGEAAIMLANQMFEALNNPVNADDMKKWIEEEQKAKEEVKTEEK